MDFISGLLTKKVFTVAKPRNAQNDNERVCVPAASRKRHVASVRLLQSRSTYTMSVMVSVCVCVQGGRTDVIFVDAGVMISGYREHVLLTQKLLPFIMREI